MSETPNVSSMLDTSGMTDKPEYPFRYVGVLLPQFREQAMKDIESCREEIEGVCAFFVPRTTKAEFMVWVRAIWEQSLEDYNDYLSSRHD